ILLAEVPTLRHPHEALLHHVGVVVDGHRATLERGSSTAFLRRGAGDGCTHIHACPVFGRPTKPQPRQVASLDFQTSCPDVPHHTSRLYFGNWCYHDEFQHLGIALTLGVTRSHLHRRLFTDFRR